MAGNREHRRKREDERERKSTWEGIGWFVLTYLMYKN